MVNNASENPPVGVNDLFIEWVTVMPGARSIVEVVSYKSIILEGATLKALLVIKSNV